MKKEHRVVFLDLDQVLYDFITFFHHIRYGVAAEAVSLLKTTLEKTNARIVFITSWDEEKIRTALENELKELAPYVHERGYLDVSFRRSDRMAGIQEWITAEYGSHLFENSQERPYGLSKDLRIPISIDAETDLRFAIVDDSTGLYTRSWANSRLVPVVTHRFMNFENQLLEALLTGKKIVEALKEMERRVTILGNILTGMWLGINNLSHFREEE